MAQCLEEMTITSESLAEGVFQVAEKNGKIIGIAQVTHSKGDADLELLYVHPDHMGAGIGRKLFNWATHHAKSLGVTRLIIVADPHARIFYEHMGTTQTGTYPSGSIPGRMLPKMVITLDP